MEIGLRVPALIRYQSRAGFDQDINGIVRVPVKPRFDVVLSHQHAAIRREIRREVITTAPACMHRVNTGRMRQKMRDNDSFAVEGLTQLTVQPPPGGIEFGFGIIRCKSPPAIPDRMKIGDVPLRSIFGLVCPLISVERKITPQGAPKKPHVLNDNAVLFQKVYVVQF